MINTFNKIISRLLLFLFILLASIGQSAELTSYRTHWKHGIYTYSAPGSLDEHLWQQWEERTNRSPLIIEMMKPTHFWVTATNALWNTNWYFYGNTENFTAQTHVRTNAGEGYWLKKSTIISRVLLLNAGHNLGTGGANDTNYGGTQWYLAIDATNGQHWRRSVAHIVRGGIAGYGDYSLAVLESPFPTNISTMKILLRTTATNKIHTVSEAPLFHNGQLGRTVVHFYSRRTGGFMQTNVFPSPPGPGYEEETSCWYWGDYYSKSNEFEVRYKLYKVGVGTNNYSWYSVNENVGGSYGVGTFTGDSGSPTYHVISNRLVFAEGSANTSASWSYFQGQAQSNFLHDVNTMTTYGGFSTNDYPIEFETLSQFPSL